MIRRLRMTVAHLKKQMDRRFTRLQREMNARFTGVDQRFVSVDQRFDAVDLRFASLERHLESLGEKLDSIAKTLDNKIDKHFRAVHEHENRITDLEAAERARTRAPQ
jgi:chaperonin cofactor prefoldin